MSTDKSQLATSDADWSMPEPGDTIELGAAKLTVGCLDNFQITLLTPLKRAVFVTCRDWRSQNFSSLHSQIAALKQEARERMP